MIASSEFSAVSDPEKLRETRETNFCPSFVIHEYNIATPRWPLSIHPLSCYRYEYADIRRFWHQISVISVTRVYIYTWYSVWHIPMILRILGNGLREMSAKFPNESSLNERLRNKARPILSSDFYSTYREAIEPSSDPPLCRCCALRAPFTLTHATHAHAHSHLHGRSAWHSYSGECNRVKITKGELCRRNNHLTLPFSSRRKEVDGERERKQRSAYQFVCTSSRARKKRSGWVDEMFVRRNVLLAEILNAAVKMCLSCIWISSVARGICYCCGNICRKIYID